MIKTKEQEETMEARDIINQVIKEDHEFKTDISRDHYGTANGIIKKLCISGYTITKEPPERDANDIHKFLCLAHDEISNNCRHKRFDFENDEITCKVNDYNCCPGKCVKMGYVYDALKKYYLKVPK